MPGGENTQMVTDSYSAQAQFQGGPAIADLLAPSAWSRTRTPFCSTWREVPVSAELDWGSTFFGVDMPESLRVVQSAYLRIKLPATTVSGQLYKAVVGAQVCTRQILKSAGNTVTDEEFSTVFADCLASFSEHKYATVVNTLFGGTAASAAATDVYVPIFVLPNSSWAQRSDFHRGLGALPCQTGSNRLRIEFSMAAADHVVSTGNAPSISNRCSIIYREAHLGSTALENAYADMRGQYSLITRRFTDISGDWTSLAASTSTYTDFVLPSPQGCVTELIIYAIPSVSNAKDRDYYDVQQMDYAELKCDSVTILKIDSKQFSALNNAVNGFVYNGSQKQPTRFQFAPNSSQYSASYTGGFDFSSVSQVVLRLRSAAAVLFKVIAINLATVKMDSSGVMRSYLT